MAYYFIRLALVDLSHQELVRFLYFSRMPTLDLNNRKFTALFNSVHGQVNQETIFTYHQKGEMIWATYSGGEVKIGTLSGQFIDDTRLYFHYGHWDLDGNYRSGKCHSEITVLADGRLRIHEEWVWDDESKKGESTLVEII